MGGDYFDTWLQDWADTSCNETGYLCLNKYLHSADPIVKNKTKLTTSDCGCPSECEETLYYMEMSFSKTLEKAR